MRLTVNSDKQLVEKIRAEIKENNGYCPLAIAKNNSDDVCMCKKFRDKLEKREPGTCDCGLYVIINDDKN